MVQDRTVYPDSYALSELPWFESREPGHIVTVDPDIGPVVDVHTHLALSYVRRVGVDLWREFPRTEHYLPLEQRLDMHQYVNRNFSPTDLKNMKRDLTLGSVTRSGMRRTHTAANLLREMKELGVVTSVLLPIDFPFLSQNAEVFLEVATRTPNLISMGSVHPYARNVKNKLAQQKAAGAVGVKVHPAVQSIAADNPRAMKLYRMCADLSLPILWHCGPVGIEPLLGRYLSQLKHYWRAVHDNPDTTFVLGHSGGLQWEMALELARTYPNVYLEITSQGLPAIRRIIDEGPAERVMFGSDWPFYHQVIPLAKVLVATEKKPGVRKRMLWENAARLFGLDEAALKKTA